MGFLSDCQLSKWSSIALLVLSVLWCCSFKLPGHAPITPLCFQDVKQVYKTKLKGPIEMACLISIDVPGRTSSMLVFLIAGMVHVVLAHFVSSHLLVTRSSLHHIWRAAYKVIPLTR